MTTKLKENPNKSIKNIKSVKPQRPKDYASSEYKKVFGNLSIQSSILNTPRREFAFQDFNSKQALTGHLKETQKKLIQTEQQLDHVISQLSMAIDRQRLQGKKLSYPDKQNYYAFRGLQFENISKALAQRDVAVDEIAQLKRDIAKIEKAEKERIESIKLVKPAKLLGIIQHKKGLPVKVDGMKIIMRGKTPFIDDAEYYGALSIQQYMEFAVLPWKEKRAKRLKNEQAQNETAIASGQYNL